MSSGKSFIGKLIRSDGSVEEVELIDDKFFLDNLLEEELGVSLEFIEYFFPKGHALAYDAFARAADKPKNGTASALCGQVVYGDVLLIPRQYIRESGKEQDGD